MNSLKSIFFLFFLIYSLHASILKPNLKINVSGGVTDLVVNNNKIYIATKSSKVDILNIKTKQIENSITVPKIKDFMGDIVHSKVYSIDSLNNNVLILSQGNKGGRNIDIYNNGKLTNIISDQKRMFIAKAKFINENKIIFSLLSNQLYLYDIKNKKFIYDVQISQSKFSDFSISENKKEIIIADESGDLKLHNTINGKYIKSFEGKNLDNVFQVDYKNGIILTAGQDRKSVVYSDSETYFKSSNFLIYSCGLSPSGKIAAFSSNEDNDVTIFNIKTKKELYTLKENKMVITNLFFINEDEIFVTSDNKIINYYKLKEEK